jgi:hypothetical protein
MKAGRVVLLCLALLTATTSEAVLLTGQVKESLGNNAVVGARVTLFNSDLRLFREQRTDLSGKYSFDLVAEGNYRLGIAALRYEYQERGVVVTNAPVTNNFVLLLETNGGRWTIVGDTEPELLDGSGSGSLLPSGEVLFCHNTEEPIVFDPVAALKWYPPDSTNAQGCHMVTLNTSGALMFCGGSMGGNPLDPVVKTVKTYWRNTNAWTRLADMKVARWYAGLVRLPDERIMIMGGELDNPSYGRTNGCEIWNPASNTWTITGSFNLPTEIAPAILLYTGEVLKTWRYPEIYNVGTGLWRPAATMVQTRNGAAGGDHADHECVFLPDGRIMAVGIAPTVTNASTRFVEFYDPTNNVWSLGPNSRAIRNRPEALILPDGRVLSFGGQYSGPAPAPVATTNAGTIPYCTKVADLWDPASNAWRAMADMNRFIHYHNVTVLVPDGRVIATGGAGVTSNRSFAGDDSSIEAFEPPYLFRGVRPRIDSLSTTEMVVGSNFTFKVSFASSLTKVILVSARATSHWVDGGPQRYLALTFTQTGADVQATIPNDAVRALAGYYILFAMVDDVPSVGRIVRVTPTPAPRPGWPTVTLGSADNAGSEPGANTASFMLTRDVVTAAPLLVNYSLGGTAVNGSDYNAISNFAVIPAGAPSTTVAVTPLNDALAEGTESVSVAIGGTSHYNAGASTNAALSIADDEAAPPLLKMDLALALTGSGGYELTVMGAASRVVDIESSSDLVSWQPLTSMINASGTNRLFEAIIGSPLFFRARQAQ